jgi:hypothetical protein
MGRNYSRVLTFLLLSGLALAVTNSCSLAKSKEISEVAVKRFHDQFNTAKFTDIYRETDDQFKQAVSEQEFSDLLQAVQRKLGTVKDVKGSSWGVNTTTAGAMATLSYDVEFTEGRAAEQFVFHITGNQAKLVRYNINSPLLITK